MPKQKVRSAKAEDDSKKHSKIKPKNTTAEDSEATEPASYTSKDEQQTTQTNNAAGLSSEAAINSALENKESQVGASDESVEIKYEEPVLNNIVVESYEGEKEKGLFQGKGKAIYKGGNVYEGDFYQGMMNGKGKYTWLNGISYEGDFVNNELTGTAAYKWFDPNDSDRRNVATYEGSVVKGKRHGFGVFKSGRTPLTYAGEWNMGKRYGKGKMIYNADESSFYEGDWINNRKFGWGIRQYASGNIYEGMWVNDIRHGEGTMKWFDKNQTYTGQWENGQQNGLGEHNWYLARVEMTQYALRNTYYGTFVNGKRHGQGTFLYANGAKYEGSWENNKKHGWGKYTFKDGSVYEGYFEDDKMTDAPTYKRVSKLSKEISKIRTRIPSAGTTLNIQALNASGDLKKIEFDLKLDLSSIIENFATKERQDLEYAQALKTIVRYIDLFKQIYRFYSQLGFDSSPDNTFVLNRMQFWRFLKDCKIHINQKHLTLMDFDRHLNLNMNSNDLHCPYDKILIRQFFNYIVLTSFHLYKDEFDGNGSLLSCCIEKIITDNILPYACNVQGYFYSDVRKTLTVLNHLVKAYETYRFLCSKRRKTPHDWSLTLRKFLYVLSEYKLLDSKLLSTRTVVEIMSSDNPLVFDSNDSYNLEFEITFLEFFEILIGCALLFGEKQNESAKSRKKKIESKSETREATNEAANRENELAQAMSEMPQAEEQSCEQRIATQTIEALDFIQPVLEVERSAEENAQKLEQEYIQYAEKISTFFEKKFFPFAEQFESLTQLANSTLDAHK